MKRLIFTLALITLAIFRAGHSQELFYSADENSPLTCILTEYHDSVIDCRGGKIYLKPEKIGSDGEDLFLENDENILKIPFVCVDTSGYYLLAKPYEQFNPWYICTNPNCKYVWHVAEGSNTGSTCPKCGSPGRLGGI